MAGTSISAFYTTPTSVSPPVPHAVTGLTTEIPAAGPTFAMGGADPRLEINYQAYRIDLRFLRPTATYVPGTSFTFTNINPVHVPPWGCPETPEIVGVEVNFTSNAGSGAATFLTPNGGGVTFTGHSITVRLAGSTNFTWQEYDGIGIRPLFGCPGTATQESPSGGCCPPWNAGQLKSMLFYQGTGAIGSAYTLRFIPTPALNSQMNGYISYLKTLGLGFASVIVQFELFDGGTGTSSIPTGGALATHASAWTGIGSATPNFLAPGMMDSNRWYRIRTRIILSGGPGTAYLPSTCVESFVDVRLQVI